VKAAAVKIPVARKTVAKVTVSESNITKAAMRLLSQRLVSSEIHYVQRVLGATATQEDIDTNVLAVRKLPWNSIVVAD
jgi:hypothetical protein